jgi:gliding motility-associated-like protein
LFYTVKDSVTITAGPALSVKALTDSLKCHYDKTGEITLIVTSGVAPYHFSWPHDISLIDSISKNLYAGTYHYKVTDLCGSVEDSVTITQPDALTISTKITNASTDHDNNGTVTVTVTGGTSPYSYSWSNGASMQNLDNLAYGTYQLTVTDANQCDAHIDSVIVGADEMTIVIYNAFTPNNDGTNDVWNIKNIQSYTKCSIRIFNEWGNEVFTSTGYATPWDGTYNGKALPAATYYYIIDLGNGTKPYTGTVNIIY